MYMYKIEENEENELNKIDMYTLLNQTVNDDGKFNHLHKNAISDVLFLCG